MAAEENSIFDEINEELKHDEILKFFKEHKNTVSWIIVLLVAGIVGHSMWYSDKRKRMEIATTGLYNEIYSSALKNEANKNEANEKKTKATLENLVQNAPSELIPLISLIKTGREIGSSEETEKVAKQLLELSEKKDVDVIWRDLAILMYISYKLESGDKQLERLDKLTGEDHPFRFTALEKIAMIYADKNDYDRAMEVLKKITDDKEAPSTMKKRVARTINYFENHKKDSGGNS